MKRYLLFAGGTYYAGGGMNDFIGSFDEVPTLEFVSDFNCKLNGELILSKKSWDEGEPETIQWYQIYDTKTEDMIQRGDIHS